MSQAAQLGQQGSDRGQYGQTPMATPYGMNGMANANQQQNENTQNVGDYSPMLPANTLTQGQPKQWYPGMYPSTSPQFGTNPYAPQTFNVQGHPGHNPSTFAAVEPNINNSAMSNQGQFVQQMARGGSSKPAPVNGGFTYTNPAKQWAGPVSTNAPSYQTENPVDSFSSMKGLGMRPQQQPSGMGMKGTRNPELATAMGKGPAQAEKPQEVIQPVQNSNQVYAPRYDQYAPVRTNIDSYGNPLFNHGGSIKE
jgi:hypothetical protein